MTWMDGISASVLSSGSIGNSFLITAQDRAVLVDAGISCRELDRRMSSFGVEPSQVDAVLLTHEHADHMRGVRRFCGEHQVPVYATRGTLALTPLDGVEKVTIAAGLPFEVGPFWVSPFKVRHLAAEPVAFSLSYGARKIGIASDLGCVTPNVVDQLKGSDLMFVEANYDERMLLTGNYPEFLKRTIKGDHGHLSNDDAGKLSAKSTTPNTQRVILVHLSKENNTPEKAKDAVESHLRRSKLGTDVHPVEHGAPDGPF
jgi:phosphoribosyl 1,2-cyclic phosphodiesterase